MQGMLVSKDGQVQVIGNTDPLEYIDVLTSLVAQLQEASREKHLQQLKNYSSEELVSELKSRATNDTSVSK